MKLMCYLLIVLASAHWLSADVLLSGARDPEMLFKDEAQIGILRAIEKRDYAAADLGLLGVSVNKRGTDGVTLLWWMVNVGDIDGFHYLLRKGANPSSQISNGPSVLELCAMQDDSNFLVAALAHGANPNMVSEYNRWTPIFTAVVYRRIENIEILINAGAFLDIADSMGYTPVLIASDNRAYAIVADLLRRGANPSWKTVHGHNLEASLLEASVTEGSPEARALNEVRTILEAVNVDGRATTGYQPGRRLRWHVRR